MFTNLILLLLSVFVLPKSIHSDSLQTQVLEARQLYPFQAYKDVQLFHYTIPQQVFLATFQYKANGSLHCPPKAISVYLQYGSYPVMSPQNASYPKYFDVKRMFLHNITLYSDLIPITLNITNPFPGNWYAAAFLVENSERIAQKGLFIPCSSWLSSSLKLGISNNVINLLHDYQISSKVSGSQIYRFFGLRNSWLTKVNVTQCQPSELGKCPVIIGARQLGLPSSTSDSQSSFVNCSQLLTCSLTFVPAVDNWNYISINSLGTFQFDMVIETEACKDRTYFEEEVSSDNVNFNRSHRSDLIIFSEDIADDDNDNFCWPTVPLIRISLPTNLAFEYNFPPDEDDIYPLTLNISNRRSTSMSFQVLPNLDIGGTLVVELAISPLVNLSQSIVSVTGCLKYGIRPVFESGMTDDGSCISVNSSQTENRFASIFVPFPEAGTWYLKMMAECLSEDSANNSAQPVSCDLPKTPIFLRIRSAPCILGQCGKYGTCYQYVSGGLIFSTCNCIAGYKGWGCTDNSTAHSDAELMLYVLLLTLSNLLFIPAIVLSICRKYFTEAFVYSSTMVFSALYHACDAEVHSYCITRLSVLQFCDFYSAILSVWVTLVALANVPTALQSLVHLAGAVGVALGVEYDRTGLWVFVIPTGIGLGILILSWVIRCYKKRLCYPSQRIWICHLFPGSLLAFSGLIVYAFYETKNNYPFVHSVWHATIALSILFLLPKKKVNRKSTPEPTSSCSYIRVGDVSCPDNTAVLPVGTAYTHLLAPTP